MSADNDLMLVFAGAAALIVFAILSQLATERWRLVAAFASLFAASGAASVAFVGLEPWTLERLQLPYEAALVIRIAAAVIALWATYVALDQVRAWWRVGDNTED
jgi:hypothetical protein